MAETYRSFAEGDSYREMSAAAHGLLRTALANKLKIPENEIIISKDEKGKPYVVGRNDVFVSLSHSKRAVMCAVSDRDVGVDIEMCSKRRKSVESRVFTEGEIYLINSANDENRAFFTLWTLKESYLKAIGTGFADNAKKIEFYSLENPIVSNNPDYVFTVGEDDCFVFAVCEKN